MVFLRNSILRCEETIKKSDGSSLVTLGNEYLVYSINEHGSAIILVDGFDVNQEEGYMCIQGMEHKFTMIGFHELVSGRVNSEYAVYH